MTTRAASLLPPLQKLVRRLEGDLRERSSEVPELSAWLREEYAAARAAARTGEAFEVFQEELLTQAAVAWVVAAVFVRFLEDNGLLDSGRQGAVRYLSGATLELVETAREQERAFYRERSDAGEREYLLWIFEKVATLPGLDRLFDRETTPLWRLGPSADGAKALLDVLREREPGEGGEVLLTFVAPGLDTRFLGDLYQDLSEAARKRYALLQTPEFVESFLLDRTLDRAIDVFGLDAVKLIDPACGSGHFLLGAFARLVLLHLAASPAENPRALVQRALDQVAGVDLNPFAAAIARFRLLVAALVACGIEKLADAPAFRLKVAAGDSLLHGRRPSTLFSPTELKAGGDHYFASEDREQLEQILNDRYAVVVGNPPYITVKDPGLRDLYRSKYSSCHGKYSLVCPFMERVFDLAQQDGFVAVIVANSFMKREFGKKLIMQVLPKWDMTHVIDTSGAYIPGHGTPTVIVIGRARMPFSAQVRAVMGIRGEPSTPANPALGLVWLAIVGHVDQPNSADEFVSVSDLPRSVLATHPWSLQGGGASEVKAQLTSGTTLAELQTGCGVMALAGNDEVFIHPNSKSFHRLGVEVSGILPLVAGESIRDWTCTASDAVLFPHNPEDGKFRLIPTAEHYYWRFRTELRSYIFFGKNREARGLDWREMGAIMKEKLREPLSISFAFVATHNHFVLDRGARIFSQSAPVIKLHADTSVQDHFRLVGLLNSSTACFWMKQMFFCRGSTVDQRGARQTTVPFEDFWEHDSTKLLQFPLSQVRPVEPAQTLDDLANELAQVQPAALAERQAPSRIRLQQCRGEDARIRRQMVFLQEELDWQVYRLYGLIDDDLTYPDKLEIELGERAFEIALARKMAAGEVETRWFERHGSTPRTDIPAHWPEAYRQLIERRLDAIDSIHAIELIERPEYKRRWAREPWEKAEKEALRNWLLDRLEAPALWQDHHLRSAAHLAELLRDHADFQQVAELYAGRADFDATRLVSELIEDEGVPYLSRLRFKESGLRKRQVWEKVWDLQRQEDAIDARAGLPAEHPEHLDPAAAAKAKKALDIPVPPKYASADFTKSSYWRLRGKLDVPKERFILYPGAERQGDRSLAVGWAGWNHLQKAQALAHTYLHLLDREAQSRDRLLPLLEGLEELVPWLRQWHNEVDENAGIGLGDYFQGFVEDQKRRLGTG